MQERANDKFQITCGECFLALERYKLKTNLLGCNLNKEDFQQFYNYYEGKTNKRLAYARSKIEEMVAIFQKNSVVLHALELKTLNNMLKNYRMRMDLMTNQPTNFNYAKFEQYEPKLMEAIILNDLSKAHEFEALLFQIQKQDELCAKSLQEKLKGKDEKNKFEKAFRAISRSEIRYCRYYETFQRNLSNMVNQLHSHIDKLSQFYTVWENLGSSLIYQLKSDREVRIDKTLEERKNRNGYFYIDDNEEEIKQIIQVLPPHSRLRQQYQERLQQIEIGKERAEKKLDETIPPKMTCIKGNPSNLKYHYSSLNRANWYENVSKQRKIFNPTEEITLKETDDGGFFRYTFEELHQETVQYIAELKSQKALFDNSKFKIENEYAERYFGYQDRRARQQQKKQMQIKIEQYNVPPQMKFNCWNDRLGSKGFFALQDFPMNLVQRKIQFEMDRQAELRSMDEKRRRQYNIKGNQLGNIDDERQINMGYRFLDMHKELDFYKHHIMAASDPEFLPKPKKMIAEPVDFSDSDEEQLQSLGKKISHESRSQPIVADQKIIPKEEEDIMQQHSSITNISDCPWLRFKHQDQKSKLFQIFVEYFLPQLEQSFQASSDDQQIIHTEFVYLPNCQFSTIRSKIKQMNLNKVVLLSHFFYAKIEELSFRHNDPQFKVTIGWVGDFPQTQQLKKSLSEELEPVGKCRFKLSQEDFSASSKEQTEYYLLGRTIAQIIERGDPQQKTMGKQLVEWGKNYFEEFIKYRQMSTDSMGFEQ